MSRRTLWILSVALGVTMAAPLRAQQLGVTVARTSSDIYTTYGDGSGGSYPNRTAISAGLTYRHALRSRLVLQPELLWVAKGNGRPTSPTRSLGYLEMPVLLRFGALAPTGAAFSPFFSIGPTVAVLVSCRLQGLQAISDSDRCNQVITQPFAYDYRTRRIDAGAMLGLGLEARTKDGSVVGVEGRVEVGLVDSERAAGTSRNTTVFVMLHWVPARRPF